MKNYCFISLFAFFLLTGCSSSHGIFEDKYGKYQYTIFKSNGKDLPVICGNVYDYQLKTKVGNLSAISLDGDTINNWTKNGFFLFKVKEGTHRFTVFGFPYDSLTTRRIKVHKGDTLKFDIYIQPYSKPIP